jgi:hypothetical protein
MKHTYEVSINGLKHEIKPKTQEVITTLHLELPGDADLRFLQKVYQRFKDPGNGQLGTFRLHIEDPDGRRRTFDLFSEGTKTKDFVLLAVVNREFNAHDGFEKYFAQVYFDGEPRPILTFEAELFQANALLEAVDRMNNIPGVESVTLSSGGKSVTLTGKNKRKLDA